MIQPDYVKAFFPPYLADNPLYSKYLIKEYLQLLILDYLSTTSYIKKLTFIGGTNLRLVKGIDRFSEDLDFDCKNFPENELRKMTNDVIAYLNRSGYRVETRDSKNKNLKAFRAGLYFPALLYNLNLTGHREEKFLIKIECQDQAANYDKEVVNIKGCGFFFPMTVPDNEVLCSMKLTAMLERQKGRDFYDVMFLLSQTLPDFKFLYKKAGISNMIELKKNAFKVFHSVNLNNKKKDFEHLIFNKNKSDMILNIEDFFVKL